MIETLKELAYQLGTQFHGFKMNHRSGVFTFDVISNYKKISVTFTLPEQLSFTKESDISQIKTLIVREIVDSTVRNPSVVDYFAGLEHYVEKEV